MQHFCPSPMTSVSLEELYTGEEEKRLERVEPISLQPGSRIRQNRHPWQAHDQPWLSSSSHANSEWNLVLRPERRGRRCSDASPGAGSEEGSDRSNRFFQLPDA